MSRAARQFVDCEKKFDRSQLHDVDNDGAKNREKISKASYIEFSYAKELFVTQLPSFKSEG